MHSAAVTEDLTYTDALPAQSVEVPGFAVPCPPLLRDGQVVQRASERIGSGGKGRVVEVGRVDVFHLRDVDVVGDGFMFDQRHRLIENVSRYPNPTAARNAYDALVTAIAAGDVRRQPGYTILGRHPDGVDYDRFLLEVLPWVVIGKSVMPSGVPGVLIPREQPAMTDVMLRALRLAGIDPADVVPQYDVPVGHFENLLVIAGLADASYLSPVAVRALGSLTAEIRPAEQRKLLLTGEAAWVRSNTDLTRRLAAQGFVAIDPLDHPLEEQIALFKGAEVVVDFGGPGFANLVFCQAGTAAISVSPAPGTNTLRWLIAAHQRLNYLEIQTGVSPSGDCPMPSEADMAFLEQASRQLVADFVQAHD